MIAGFMSLLFFVVVVTLAVVLVVVRLGRRGKRVREPVCGACGYAVWGLETFICPECGGDLREVGITTPNTQRALSPIAVAVLWTVLLPIPALIVSGAVYAVLPQVYYTSNNTTLSSPGSGAYRNAIIRASGASTDQANAVDAVKFRLTTREGRLTDPLVVDADDMSWQIAGGSVSGEDFSAETMLAYMKAVGIDVENPRVQTEAMELAGTVANMATGVTGISTGAFNSVTSGSGGSSRGQAWFPVVALVIWIFIWLAGVFFVLRKRD